MTALPLPLHLVHRQPAQGTNHKTQPVVATSDTTTEAQPAIAPTPTTAESTPTPTPPVPTPARASAPKRQVERAHAHVWRLALPAPRKLHGARDPSDTISDFKYTPATLTIHVGDTVTWTNQGQQPHTATANDHSFDTGILNKGASASHTFTQAGTFSYFCTVHPFMHGTIVVVGSSGSSGSTSSSGSSGSSSGSGSSGGGSGGSTTSSSGTSASSSGASSTGSGSALPMTGLNVSLTVLTGAVLLGGGLALLRGSRIRRDV